LKPIQGGQGEVERERFMIDAGAVDLFVNDPVVLNADGKLERAVAGGGNKIRGTVCSIHDATEMPREYFPSGEVGWFAEITNDPDQLYEIIDPTVQLADPAEVGANANLRFEAPDTVHKLSGCVVDTATGTGATMQLRIVGPLRRGWNFRRFQDEAHMLKFAPLTREQGRLVPVTLGEIVYRVDLDAYYVALNTDNADMGDWQVCVVGDSGEPRWSWKVRINYHQLRNTTGI
jgi:hypothetical protein